MYNRKDIQFEGKHDFYPLSKDTHASYAVKSISTRIVKLELRTKGKSLKDSKAIVRVHGPLNKIDDINKMAENIVKDLDEGNWDGRKNVFVK